MVTAVVALESGDLTPTGICDLVLLSFAPLTVVLEGLDKRVAHLGDLPAA